MKQFLWIAHFFPPVNSIAGLRTARLAAYLLKFGWEPIIVTRRWEGESGQVEAPGLHVIRTDYVDRLGLFRSGHKPSAGSPAPSRRTGSERRGMRFRLRYAVARGVKEVLACPDEFVGWKPFAIEAGRRVLTEVRPDLILSTSYPFTSHLAASRLQQESGLPWIAEYHDPWTQSPAWHSTRLRLGYESWLERRTVARAAALIIVTLPWAEGLRVLHGKPVAVIENGFDQAEYEGNPPPLTPQFTITYTGMIYAGPFLQRGYGGRRDPLPLFEAVKDLLDDGTLDPSCFAIRFYGPPNERPVILALAEQQGVAAVVAHHGMVPHEEAILRQRESTLLLLLNWHGVRMTYKEQGWYTGKVYEYLGARRPILALPRHPGVDALLTEMRAGVSVDTRAELAHLLRDWYREFQTTGTVAWNGDASAIQAHTWHAQAEHLSRLLDEVLAVQTGQKACIAPDVAR